MVILECEPTTVIQTNLLCISPSPPPHSHDLGSLVTINSARVPLGMSGYGSGQDPTNTVGARWPNALFPFPGGGNDCPNTSTVDALFLSGMFVGRRSYRRWSRASGSSLDACCQVHVCVEQWFYLARIMSRPLV